MADTAEDQEGAAPAPPPKAKKGGAMKWVAIGALVVMLGGAAAAWWMLGGSTTEAAASTEPELSSRGVFAFEPFLVNLADDGGQRFLDGGCAPVDLVEQVTARSRRSSALCDRGDASGGRRRRGHREGQHSGEDTTKRPLKSHQSKC